METVERIALLVLFCLGALFAAHKIMQFTGRLWDKSSLPILIDRAIDRFQRGMRWAIGDENLKALVSPEMLALVICAWIIYIAAKNLIPADLSAHEIYRSLIALGLLLALTLLWLMCDSRFRASRWINDFFDRHDKWLDTGTIVLWLLLFLLFGTLWLSDMPSAEEQRRIDRLETQCEHGNERACVTLERMRDERSTGTDQQ